jgi:hypothetical protein
LLVELALLAGVCLCAGWIIGQTLSSVPFHGVESAFAGRSGYFRWFFLDWNLDRREWSDYYQTHTQPMLANYVVGGSLWAHGYPVGPRLRIEHHQDYTDLPMLTAARAPMLFFGTGTILLLYLLGRVLSGRVTGLTAATLALGSPVAQASLPQARTEPLLCFFFLLALLLSTIGARRPRDGHLPAHWAVAVGTCLGLAFATKLTAVFSLVAVLSWAILAAVGAVRLCPAVGPRTRLGRAWWAARGWFLALAVALGVFVLSNPHLYANPALHTLHLFQQRAEEMEEQFMEGKGVTLPQPLSRPLYLLDQSVYRAGPTGSRGASLEVLLARMDILLASIGVLVLARRLWSSWRRKAAPPAEGLLLLTAAVYFVGISATLWVGWSRYALPTLLLGTILSGLGLAAVLPRLVPVELTRVVRTRLAPRFKPARVEQRPLERSRGGGVVTNGTA